MTCYYILTKGLVVTEIITTTVYTYLVKNSMCRYTYIIDPGIWLHTKRRPNSIDVAYVMISKYLNYLLSLPVFSYFIEQSLELQLRIMHISLQDVQQLYSVRFQACKNLNDEKRRSKVLWKNYTVQYIDASRGFP